MIGIITGGVVTTALAFMGRGYMVQRANRRTGPNSRARVHERVVAVRTNTLTNNSARVGHRSLIHRFVSRLRSA